ncbi:hypothetical protein DAI22_09g046500 [Oryza sativa Japonica Group]|nr:hypothetical protein DAI22_09g046500 [Oryza sativa Japonica Group]
MLRKIMCLGYTSRIAVICILLHMKDHPFAFHVACNDLFRVCCYTLPSGTHSSCPAPGGVCLPRQFTAVLGEDRAELQ